jgi:antigen flippase
MEEKSPPNHHFASVSSTLITGGSQAITAVLAIVRTKMAAIWLGPEGVGVVGLLGQMQNVLVVGLDLGVSNSAVRDISVIRSKNDSASMGRVIGALFKLTSWSFLAAGILGWMLSLPLSEWMFNTPGRSTDVCLTAIAAGFLLQSGSHGTLMRGHGMLRQLAVQRIIVGVAGTMLTLAGYYWFGDRAIAPVLLATAVSAWIFSRLQTAQVIRGIPIQASVDDLRQLVVHGLPFLWSAGSFAAVSYLIGVMVVDYSGLASSGYYQAAWGVTAYLVGFVLSAMGQDFLPRLSAQIGNKTQACDMINSQIEIGLLMALPGLFMFSALATHVFPWLFSDAFGPAVPIAQITLLGCLGRLTSWPMLFALNALRKSRQHMLAVTAASAAYLLMAWSGLREFGIIGAAGGFVLMQVFHSLWLRLALSSSLDFRFTSSTLLTMLVAVGAMIAAPFMPWKLSAPVGALLTLGVLARMAWLTGRPRWIRHLLSRHKLFP